MKKVIVIISCVLGLYSLGICQDMESLETVETVEKSENLELGFNGSPLLQKIVSPQSLFNSNDLTLLLINLRLTDRFFLRSGYNVNFSEVNFPEDSFTSSNSTSSIGTRLGLEWRNSMSPLWQLHYGFDLIYRYTKQEFISQSFDQFGNLIPFVSDVKRNTYGLGPVLGITFWPHPRIGIFTEAGFYFTRFEQKDTTTFDGTQNTFNQFDGTNGNSLLPTSLMIKIKL